MISYTAIPVSTFCTIIDRKNPQIVQLLIPFCEICFVQAITVFYFFYTLLPFCKAVSGQNPALFCEAAPKIDCHRLKVAGPAASFRQFSEVLRRYKFSNNFLHSCR
jgi:hypothetical protein